MKGLSAKKKLIAAALTMLIALVMIVGTTLAWYSISVNPVVDGMTFNISGPETLKLARNISGTDPQYLDYKETLSLSDIFSEYFNLIPVSTADLVNWFLPVYNDDGTLDDPDNFILDSTLKYANVGKYEINSDGLKMYEYEGNYYTLAELQEIYSSAIGSEAIISSALQNPKEVSLIDQFLYDKIGYYVYTDMWMTTDNEYGSVVRLSYPHYGVEGAVGNNDMSGAFGTYVLPKLGISGGALTSLSNNSETSVRIGFQIYADEDNPDTVTGWYIFEPNADTHSLYSKKPDGEDAYVIGYDKESAVVSNGMYVKTLPLSRQLTGSSSDLMGNEIPVYSTLPSDIPASNGIIQMACAWKEDETLTQAVSLGRKINSNYLSSFGKIVNSEQLLNLARTSADGTVKLPAAISDVSTFTESEAVASSSIEFSNVSEPLFTIEYGHYVRIRMFVWIEGQDTDCWNDVASGSFIVNLEFSESDLHPEGDAEYDGE